MLSETRRYVNVTYMYIFICAYVSVCDSMYLCASISLFRNHTFQTVSHDSFVIKRFDFNITGILSLASGQTQ